MKLATYKSAGKACLAIVHDGDRQLFDLAEAARRAGQADGIFASMLALIDAGDSGLDVALDLFDARKNETDLSVAVSGADLMAPLPEPRQMRDGMSFETHIRNAPRGGEILAAIAAGQDPTPLRAKPAPEMASVYRQLPIYYITNRLMVGPPNSTVLWPRYSQMMDFELEFGIITKNTTTDIKVDAAKNHIFGYTIFNDFSARDKQRVEMQGRLGPAKGKSFNGSNVLGPWIVTPDEIGNPYNLRMQARINGHTCTDSLSKDMLWSFEEILAYVSQDETIHAGEFFGSGTVGNGCGLELGRMLQSGDVIELEVENIGILCNKVVQQTR